MKKFFKMLLLAVTTMIASGVAYAQVTTSALGGKITDDKGETVIGAAIIATHVPSGTSYGAVTNVDGRYSIQGMRTGGPYIVEVSCLGYQSVKFTDIKLALGENYVLDGYLNEDAQALMEAVVIAAPASRFAATKTGASMNVNNEEMMALPNSSHSIGALTKLSPYSNGMSFAGSDGRSTNFTVDGANLNNNFGLSSSLPGGGTPISLDAIEEIQFVMAPFDVRQSNFVGGGINAVTKSGTNTFKGTAYVNYYNQIFRGNKINGEDLGARKAESDLIYGFTLGGPIVKNKLFFFANFEVQKKPEQVIKYTPDEAKQADLQKIADKLINDYGYNPGSYTDFPGGIDNMKMLFRLDWNISDAHKLALRFNKTTNEKWSAPNGNSCDDKFRNKAKNRSSAESHPFSGNMYSENNNLMTFSAELNSRFSSSVANRFLATYTNIDDKRGSKSDLFPHIDIMTGDYSSGAFNPYTSLGYELFTYNNGVKNKQISVSDNVTIYAGSHTIMAGASYEYMTANNSYMRNGTGYYRFKDMNDFLNGATPLSFCLTYGYDGNENPAGVVTYSQAALYLQDEWNVTPRFKLTYGLRGDILVFDNSSIFTNTNIAGLDFGGRKIDTGAWPAANLQVSPRVGFNWDVQGDKTLVVRGGTGLFQGRLPLVFFTNMPQYSGMIQGSYGLSAYFDKNNEGALTYDPAVLAKLNQLMSGGKVMTDMKKVQELLNLPTSPSAESAGFGGNASYGYIVGVDPNFKMPQIWKTSLAVDYKIPVSFPFSVTAEGMFNKTIWGVTMEDWNINTSKITSTFDGPDNRFNYRNATDYQYTDYSMYTMTNTRKGWGYTFNLTMNAEPVKNLKLMAAYTHTEAKEISGMPGSAANSVYTGMPTINGTNLSGLQRSQYVLPDKVMASVNYFLPFRVFGGNGLHVNAYYTASSSIGNSFIYSNDMNGDGNASDLIYIPATKDELNFTSEADRDAFWTFVEKDSYLSSHKGQYAEAYAARAPWVHRLDLRIAEDFSFKIGGTTHNFQLSASIDNIGNLINSKWGVARMSDYQSSPSGTIAPLKYEGVDANNIPVFSMVPVGKDADKHYPTDNYVKYDAVSSNCWRILFGLKYFFN